MQRGSLASHLCSLVIKTPWNLLSFLHQTPSCPGGAQAKVNAGLLGHWDAFIAKIWKCWWYKNFPKLSHNIGSGPIILPTLLQIKVYGALKNHICSAQNSNNRTRKIILTWFYEVHFNFWLSCDNLMPPWPPEHWSQILMMLTFSLRRGLTTLCKAELSKDLFSCRSMF